MENNRITAYMNCLKDAPHLYRAISKTICSYEKEYKQNIPVSQLLYLNVFAAALIGFVDWVLKEAEESGKNRIYFLARDGYQMYLVARHLVKLYGYHIDCKYLYVSRYSMKLPSYHLNPDIGIDSICVGGIDVTPEKILKRAALTDQEIKQVLSEKKLMDQRDRILNYQQVLELRGTLRTSQILKDRVHVHSAMAYDTAIAYLKQEGLCEDDRYFIVDSGWTGRLQESIQKLVQQVNPGIHVIGCYFGMYETPAEMNPDQFKTYYFSAKSGIMRKVNFSNSLFETIISCLDPMTLGYEEKNHHMEPVFHDNTNPNGEQMKNNIEILGRLLENIDDTYIVEKSEIIDRKTIEKLLSFFMSQPEKLEISAYGSNLFSDDVSDNDYKMVAASLTEEQIRDQRFVNKILIISGLKKNRIHESAWLEGSASRLYENESRKFMAERRHIHFYKYIVYLRKQMKRN